MIQIDLKSRKAIYEQIVDNFKELIISGILAKDEKIMSVRELAKNLALNPNTVQKAYRELESQGYIYTVLGQGSFIHAPQGKDMATIKKLYDQLETAVHELLFLGESKEVVSGFFNQVLNLKNGGKYD